MSFCSVIIEPRFGSVSELIPMLKEFSSCEVFNSKNKNYVLMIIQTPSVSLVNEIEKFLLEVEFVQSFEIIPNKNYSSDILVSLKKTSRFYDNNTENLEVT